MNLAAMMRRDMAAALAGAGFNSMDVVFVWEVVSGSEAGYDANLEGSYPDTVPVSGTARALVHFVQPLKSGVRQFAEVEAGDVILDLAHDGVPAPEGAAGLRCIIDGKTYVQKEAGKELAQYWDLVVGGERMMRTMLMTLAR